MKYGIYRMIKKALLILMINLIGVHASFATTTHHKAAAQSKKVHTTQQSKKTHKTTHASSHQQTKRTKVVAERRVTKAAPLPNDRREEIDLANYEQVTPPKHSFFSSIGTRMVDFVKKTVTTLRYSSYKLGGTHFDTSSGVYVVDCSDYVDHILKEVYPDAYFDLVNNSGGDKPTSRHYYEFFSELNNTGKDYWNKVENVNELQPGDILVFRYKGMGARNGSGHVMVVMDKPVRDSETEGFLVRVADSAPTGHSEDTRQRHVSGIGIGTLLLKANEKTGQPSAYAWKIGSRWEKNVNFAMARPMNVY